MNYDDIVSASALYELEEKQHHIALQFHNLPRPQQSYGISLMVALIVGIVILLVV